MNTDKIKELLLKEREEKYKAILSFSKKYSVIEISVNTPFFPKNNSYTDICLKITLNYLIKKYNKNILKIRYFNNFAGSFILIEINSDPVVLKNKLINFENSYRIIDIDIYYKGIKLSSKNLNLPEKKCFICNRSFNFCRMNKTHSTYEIKQAFKNIYLKLIADNN